MNFQQVAGKMKLMAIRRMGSISDYVAIPCMLWKKGAVAALSAPTVVAEAKMRRTLEKAKSSPPHLIPN